MLAALHSPGEFLQVRSCLQRPSFLFSFPFLIFLFFKSKSTWLLSFWFGLILCQARTMSWIKEGELSLWERFCANIIKVSSGPQHSYVVGWIILYQKLLLKLHNP